MIMTDKKHDAAINAKGLGSIDSSIGQANILSGTKFDGATVNLDFANAGMSGNIVDKVEGAIKVHVAGDLNLPPVCQSLQGCATGDLAGKAVAATSVLNSQSITASMGVNVR
jgi:hypothetical protein